MLPDPHASSHLHHKGKQRVCLDVLVGFGYLRGDEDSVRV